MGNSIYSINSPSTNLKPHRGMTIAKSTETGMKVLKKKLLCRICEGEVSWHLFTGHTELCAIKIQWEVRSLECDNYLRKLYTVFGKQLRYHENLAEVNEKNIDALENLKTICEEAAKLHNPSCQQTLLNFVTKASIYKVDDSYEFIHNTVQELCDWISYKAEVWNQIEMSDDLLTTLVGGKRKIEKSLSIHVPSLKDFEILKLLTKGGFARVYLAKKQNDIFAIKVLNRQDIGEKTQMEHVFAERNIMATTSCPYVVRMFYAFATRENLFLAMEFLNGGDLFSFLHAMESFDEDVARFYIAEVILALEYLHGEGIIHRGKI